MKYFYEATLVRVIDGDTIDVELDLGFGISYKTRLRLYGINCPEINTEKGKKARTFVESVLTNRKFYVKTIKDRKGKYGRYLAIIFIIDNGDMESLNKMLANKGLAKEYRE